MRRAQIAQHVVAAVVLINLGIERGTASLLPICEIAAGVLLIASVIRERFHKGHGGGVAWVELAGAAMTFVEAVERSRGHHHLSFLILSFVQPTMLLVFAVFDAQIASARYLQADDDGFEARLRLLFRRRVAWQDLRGFRVEGNAINLDLVDGKRKINLRDVVDGDAAIAWSVEIQTARDYRVSGGLDARSRTRFPPARAEPSTCSL